MNTKVMNTPKKIEIDITDRCNLRCKYCSHFESAGDVGHDLPTSEWLEFFNELGRCAVMEVTLCGGETFIREDLVALIEGIVRNRMRFGILSNGTLITDEVAAFIASTKRCNSVQVSIDGSSPEAHDYCRGEGNFLKAIQGIETLKKNNVPAAVRVTIHRKNVADLENIAKLLLEEIGLPSFSTNSASHMGVCRKNAEMVQLNTEERMLAMETLLKLNQKYNNRISANAGPLAEAKMWLAMEEARSRGAANIPGRGFLVSCGGMFSQLGVRADGVIVPCLQMSHIELGRINKDDLKETWQNHPELQKLRQRPAIPLSEFEFCRGCAYVNYCAGGCPALSYTLTGNEYGPSPDICFRQFLKSGGEISNLELINA